MLSTLLLAFPPAHPFLFNTDAVRSCKATRLKIILIIADLSIFKRYLYQKEDKYSVFTRYTNCHTDKKKKKTRAGDEKRSGSQQQKQGLFTSKRLTRGPALAP